MRMAWAFFALAVIALLGYSLNRGIYVGSRIIQGQMGQSPYATPTFGKQCRYLFPSGIHQTRKEPGWFNRDGADNDFCSLFHPN